MKNECLEQRSANSARAREHIFEDLWATGSLSQLLNLAAAAAVDGIEVDGIDRHDCVLGNLYMQKQAGAWVWPAGSGLPTPGREAFRHKPAMSVAAKCHGGPPLLFPGCPAPPLDCPSC